GHRLARARPPGPPRQGGLGVHRARQVRPRLVPQGGDRRRQGRGADAGAPDPARGEGHHPGRRDVEG
ncbi:MAG: hypothetical protein AVDCRST_MAG79-321, partial [uncultured Thermoleophilia bacterium]